MVEKTKAAGKRQSRKGEGRSVAGGGIACSNCRSDLNPEWRYCSSCGAANPEYSAGRAGAGGGSANDRSNPGERGTGGNVGKHEAAPGEGKEWWIDPLGRVCIGTSCYYTAFSVGEEPKFNFDPLKCPPEVAKQIFASYDKGPGHAQVVTGKNQETGDDDQS